MWLNLLLLAILFSIIFLFEGENDIKTALQGLSLLLVLNKDYLISHITGMPKVCLGNKPIYDSTRTNTDIHILLDPGRTSGCTVGPFKIKQSSSAFIESTHKVGSTTKSSTQNLGNLSFTLEARTTIILHISAYQNGLLPDLITILVPCKGQKIKMSAPIESPAVNHGGEYGSKMQY